MTFLRFLELPHTFSRTLHSTRSYSRRRFRVAVNG